ncbi:MAG TPA: DUF4157 domain-containing protein, partial [Kofleriaceae bacterium]
TALARLGSGHAIEAALRGDLEGQLGADLSAVRIHSGQQAGELAEWAGATAFTAGRDVVFGPGAYQPATPAGRRLVAHEIVHVLQQSASRPVLQRQPRPRADAPVSPDDVKAYDDARLALMIEMYQARLSSPALGSAEASTVAASLQVMRSEQLRRNHLQVVGAVPRPPGLPPGPFAVQPAGSSPALDASLPEGELVPLVALLRQPAVASELSGGRGGVRPTDITTPLAIAGRTANASVDLGLLSSGFKAAGPEAIGLVGVPRLLTPGARLPETLAQLGDYWGHTAIYVRQGGRITIVRGFNPAMEGEQVISLIRNFRAVESGTTSVPAAVGADAYLFTYSGARSIEYAVTPELAAQLAGRLPAVGPVAAGSGIPVQYTARPAVFGEPCVGSNCLLWAANEAEQALGHPIGPAARGVSVTALGEGGTVLPGTASQGRFIQFTRAVEGGEAVIGSEAAVASGMSRGLQVLKWGGKVFFVIGLATVPIEVALAPEGQRLRTAVGAASGFASGLAAGAAAGLLCGPGAPVCSVVLGLGFGIVGALAGRAAAEALFDSIARELEGLKEGLVEL